jgi:hypothetical protein
MVRINQDVTAPLTPKELLSVYLALKNFINIGNHALPGLASWERRESLVLLKNANGALVKVEGMFDRMGIPLPDDEPECDNLW